MPPEPRLETIIDELLALRVAVLAYEKQLSRWIKPVHRAHRASAVNLAHYLALRRVDLRRIQERLSWIGVSSLGRLETHVLANLNKVLGVLHTLNGQRWTRGPGKESIGYARGRALLYRNAETLFGSEPARRSVRIMVTLPSEAASDRSLVLGLVRGGMDIARINCAHDDAERWVRMVRNVRWASKRTGRAVRIQMDLPGPKVRTGPVSPGPAVLRIRPQRDEYGSVVTPARLGLRAFDSQRPVAGAAAHLEVDATWLGNLRARDRVEFVDARGAKRTLDVKSNSAGSALVECDRTCYFTPDTMLKLRRKGKRNIESGVRGIAPLPGKLKLHRGDVVRLVPHGVCKPGRQAKSGKPAGKATIVCLPPQALESVKKDDRIWFDDGRIGGIVRGRAAEGFDVEITVARDAGETLVADKGINLPDTALDLPCFSEEDGATLAVIAKYADLIGLSFAQSADDVIELRARLRQAGRRRPGIVLKIETKRGFEHLPEMLFAAMRGRASGVMIARGDLAVECGYERMAEIQEEILWACEAAHMPVVWATQVLETLAKTGLPSRAEITDAAMGERAECVMLNKGPHILDAIRTLDDILRRMQSHQAKKRPLLRALKSWQRSLESDQQAEHRASEA